MTRHWRAEWLLHWVPNLSNSALLFLVASIGRRWVIRRAFSDDDGGGCLAEWGGRYHPACRDLDDSGQEFLRFIGLPEQSEVVFSWDHGDRAFRKELREAVRAELKLRRVRHGQTVDVHA